MPDFHVRRRDDRERRPSTPPMNRLTAGCMATGFLTSASYRLAGPLQLRARWDNVSNREYEFTRTSIPPAQRVRRRAIRVAVDASDARLVRRQRQPWAFALAATTRRRGCPIVARSTSNGARTIRSGYRNLSRTGAAASLGCIRCRCRATVPTNLREPCWRSYERAKGGGTTHSLRYLSSRTFAAIASGNSPQASPACSLWGNATPALRQMTESGLRRGLLCRYRPRHRRNGRDDLRSTNS